MVVLIVLFVLLFLVLLLAMPVIASIYARFSPKGGIVFATLYLFGVIPIPLRLRIRLLSAPYLSLQFGKHNFPLLSHKKRTPIDPRILRMERIDLGITVGIENDGARTVQALGTLQILSTMLLPLYFAKTNVTVHPSYTHGVLRLNVRVIGLIYPLFFLRSLCISKRNKAKDTNESISEKRYSHVSC